MSEASAAGVHELNGDRRSGEGSVRWLHLSDFHFRGDDPWDRRATLEALLLWAKKTTEAGEGPDLVFLTGDIAWSGKRDEYRQAEEFFTKLADATGRDPVQHFFVVPGNHDVDRSAIGPGDASILRNLREQHKIEQILRHKTTMRLLGSRLEQFYAFTERFLGPARAYQADRPWRVDHREIAGLEVAILQLNSAWASAKNNETGKLLIGEAQIRDALAEAAAAPVRIALVHHPIADLADVDRASLETLLPASGGAHALLRGHLHRGRLLGTSWPHGELIEMAAGTVYAGGKWPRAFFQSKMDLVAGTLCAQFLVYSGEGRGFWTPDSQALEGRPDGVWEQQLPDSLRPGSTAAAADFLVAAARRHPSLAARYRAAVAAVHGAIRFVGFAGSRPRRNVQVPELFVPLRLCVDERAATGGQQPSWTTADLLTYLVETREEPPRFVVLGDHGSGKTTLCRFLALVLAGEASLEDVEISEKKLPLFLPFRDYVQQCRDAGDRDLLTYLVEQARNHLQLTLKRADLEVALGRGDAVLLLDGLDEVGAAGEREEMRERVQAFCRAWRVPVLVTSRIAGYDNAPLASGPAAFRQLRLEPFDEADLDRFVSQWYAVQEPDDLKAREEGIADLRAALAASERVRDLARNPMLATLVALVHRFEAHLPGERARLYDLCVRTLIKTWPAARKRRFSEIDEDLQRSYLEEIAYALQQRRSDPGGTVTVERADLIEMTTAIIARERGGRLEIARGVGERWVTFLEEGAGILVEQRPGVLSFFHVSLMEYLAARGWDGATDVVDGIAKNLSIAAWRDVCLLAIGSRATDRIFVDRVFERLTASDAGFATWEFLLAALGEEVAFSKEQGERILGELARLLTEHTSTATAASVNRLAARSLRHRAWIQAWFSRSLQTTHGSELLGTALLGGDDSPKVLADLARRSDAAIAAGDLLDAPPWSLLFRWAAAVAAPSVARRWLSTTPEELIISRVLLVYLEVRGMVLPAIVPLLSSAIVLNSFASIASHLDDQDPSTDSALGEESEVVVSPGAAVVHTRPCSRELHPNVLARHLGQRPWQTSASSSRFASLSYAPLALHQFCPEAPIPYAQALSQVFFIQLETATLFPNKNVATTALGIVYGIPFGLELAKAFARKGSITIKPQLREHSTIPAPSATAIPIDLAIRPGLIHFGDLEEGELELHLTSVVARLAAEGAVGAFTNVSHPREQRQAYFARRAQNVWLLHFWPIVDQHLDLDPHPDRLALYLALGWSQATTTWLWPGTPRWVEILSGPPPKEWRPLATWHLCWLLHDPDSAVHLEGFRAALGEGRSVEPTDPLIEALEDASGLS